ncbi:MAG: type II toxin-antitoxin system VapC family toxin [Acidobacteria bacterium]|nr:type II toxin-antitoxin system VapC family toxin [Acidobacteriota bacterium]
MSAVLDTHAALWYLANSKELSSVARTTVEEAIRAARDVYVSAISLVETVYLVERGRVPMVALQRLRSALDDPASGLIVAPVNADVADALTRIPRDLVPDMPDRIIAATALHLGVSLVTRDQRIRSAGIQAIW